MRVFGEKARVIWKKQKEIERKRERDKEFEWKNIQSIIFTKAYEHFRFWFIFSPHSRELKLVFVSRWVCVCVWESIAGGYRNWWVEYCHKANWLALRSSCVNKKGEKIKSKMFELWISRLHDCIHSRQFRQHTQATKFSAFQYYNQCWCLVTQVYTIHI